MLKFNYNQQEIKVNFSHIRSEFGAASIARIKFNGEEKGMGIARCSTADQFEKAVGRKIALTRALSTFDREFRTLVWDKYWAKLNKYGDWLMR